MSEPYAYRKCYCIKCLTKTLSIPDPSNLNTEIRRADYRYLEIAKELASKDAADEGNYAVKLMFKNKINGEDFEEKCSSFEDCVSSMIHSKNIYEHGFQGYEHPSKDSYIKFVVSGVDTANRWLTIGNSSHNLSVNLRPQIITYDGLFVLSVDIGVSSYKSRKHAIKCIYNPPNEFEVNTASTICLSYQVVRYRLLG